MALGQRLELKQGQGLVITPQLQQAIKLLQLSNLELEAVIETELERNPLLQRDEADPVSETDTDAPAKESDSGESRELELGDHDTIAANSDLDASTSDVYGDDEPVIRERRSVVSDSTKARWSTGRKPARAAAASMATRTWNAP